MGGRYYDETFRISDYVDGTLSASTDGYAYVPAAAKAICFGFKLNAKGTGGTTTVQVVDSAGTTIASAGIAGAAGAGGYGYTAVTSMTEDDVAEGWLTFDITGVASTTAPTGLCAFLDIQCAAD
jgi:hypothetical protein